MSFNTPHLQPPFPNSGPPSILPVSTSYNASRATYRPACGLGTELAWLEGKYRYRSTMSGLPQQLVHVPGHGTVDVRLSRQVSPSLLTSTSVSRCLANATNTLRRYPSPRRRPKSQICLEQEPPPPSTRSGSYPANSHWELGRGPRGVIRLKSE